MKIKQGNFGKPYFYHVHNCTHKHSIRDIQSLLVAQKLAMGSYSNDNNYHVHLIALSFLSGVFGPLLHL